MVLKYIIKVKENAFGPATKVVGEYLGEIPHMLVFH